MEVLSKVINVDEREGYYYNLFELYVNKFPETLKPKVMELTTEQFFEYAEHFKFDEHFKEDSEKILKHFINKSTGDEFAKLNLNEKYPQYISEDIKIEKMKAISAKEFFKNKDSLFSKTKKYFEKFLAS